MANGILGTNTDILYINAGGAGDYSGASGVFVDNVNRVISLTGDYASAIPQISANSANIAELSSKFEDCCSSVQGDITSLSSSITNISGDVINKLDISSFSAVSGNFLTAMPQGVMYEDRLNYTDDLSALSGYNGIPFSITDLSDYYKKTETSSKQEISAALASIQPGDAEVQQVVHTYSAEGKWLIASDLDPYATTAQVNTVSSLLSAGLDYVSANAGKTYTGIAPIQIDNELNEISITGEGLYAGPNIDIFSSGGYVIISGSSGRDFTNEITAASAYAYNSATAQINSTSSYLNSAITSTSSYLNGAITSTSSYLSAAIDYVSGNAGSNYTGISPIYVNNVSKQISADTWTLMAGSGVTFTDDNVNKVTVLDVTGVNTYCFNFPNGVTSVDLSTFNNYNKVTIVHSNDNMPDYHLYWDGKTKVIPSGLYCEMVKGKDNLNNIKWSFAQSAWINDNWWDWD